jgi:hypothetical protein
MSARLMRRHKRSPKQQPELAFDKASNITFNAFST